MAFGAENVKPAYIGYARAKLDIRSAACHIRRDRDIAARASVPACMLLAGFGDDRRFPRVLLGVQNLVLDAVLSRKGLRKRLAFFNADCTDKNGTARGS